LSKRVIIKKTINNGSMLNTGRTKTGVHSFKCVHDKLAHKREKREIFASFSIQQELLCGVQYSHILTVFYYISFGHIGTDIAKGPDIAKEPDNNIDIVEQVYPFNPFKNGYIGFGYIGFGHIGFGHIGCGHIGTDIPITNISIFKWIKWIYGFHYIVTDMSKTDKTITDLSIFKSIKWIYRFYYIGTDMSKTDIDTILSGYIGYGYIGYGYIGFID
jgi:hypothetical protein